MNLTMRINMKKACIECKKVGTLNDSPICMECFSAALGGKPMNTEFGRNFAAQVRGKSEQRQRK